MKPINLHHFVASLSLVSLVLNTMLFGALVNLSNGFIALSGQDFLTLVYSSFVIVGAVLLMASRPGGVSILVVHWTWLVLQGTFEAYNYIIGSAETLHPLLTQEFHLFKHQILVSLVFKLVIGLPSLLYLAKYMVDDLVKPATTNTDDHIKLL